METQPSSVGLRRAGISGKGAKSGSAWRRGMHATARGMHVVLCTRSNILASVDMKDVRWLRIGEVCRSMGYLDGKDVPLLFAEKIEPADILQGGLGDCWLLAGIASVAMHPHLIRRIFVQREYSPTGRYKLRQVQAPGDRSTRGLSKCTLASGPSCYPRCAVQAL